MSSTNFAPFGTTDDPDIKTATSIVDYIFRRLALEYLSIDDRLELGLATMEDLEAELASQQSSLLDGTSDQAPTDVTYRESKTADADIPAPVSKAVPADLKPQQPKEATLRTARAELKVADGTAPLCSNCGNVTQRAGSCYVCTSCGSTTGCS